MLEATVEPKVEPVVAPLATSAMLQDPEAEAGVAPISSEKPVPNRNDDEGADRRHLEPSSRLTGHQLFYIVGLDGFGGMALSAGVNFAIAYGKDPFPMPIPAGRDQPTCKLIAGNPLYMQDWQTTVIKYAN